MRIVMLTAVADLLCAALVAPPVFANDSCGGGCPTPPSCARAVSANAVPLGDYFASPNVLSATLAAGKPGTILMADGLLTDGPYHVVIPRAFALGISVNGLRMQPGFSVPGQEEVVEDCGVFRTDPDGFCAVTAHWWLDMDDPANAALLGVPITVTLNGGDLFGGPDVGDPVDMSLRVRLQKK